MKAQAEEKNHAIDNAKGWMQTILEDAAALEMDWERFGELKDTDEEDLDDEEKEELAELKKTATIDGEEFENADDVRERIEERPLSIQVRSGWYSPGDDSGSPEEFEILLSTGGPALRIMGDLDEYGQPTRAYMQWQDWGTPWTDYYESGTSDALLTWVSVFYFGE